MLLSFQRFNSSLLGKAIVASAVLAAIMGGWSYSQRSVQHARILPGGGGRQGACVLWFVGSSSISRWVSLGEDMRPWTVHNRGVAGATFDEIRYFFSNEKEVRRPQAIVIYAGENDIAFGGSARGAIDDLKAFLKAKTDRFGNAPVFVVSLKPSPTRWHNLSEQQAFNAAAKRIAAKMPDVSYIDIVPLLMVNNRPGPFYAPDGIHMNEAGYRLWSGAIRTALSQRLSRKVVERCDPGGTETHSLKTI